MIVASFEMYLKSKGRQSLRHFAAQVSHAHGSLLHNVRMREARNLNFTPE